MGKNNLLGEHESHETSRATVPGLEEILGKEFRVLDHGFIRVIDYMGSDSSIVQAARVSYGKGTKKSTQDRGLIRYLIRNRHTTPLEMCEIKIHVKLPIFIARQWIRHRTANVNEYSARYSIMDREFYVPDRKYLDALIDEAQIAKKMKTMEESGQTMLFDDFFINKEELKVTGEQSESNKQGRGNLVSESEAEEGLKIIQNTSNNAYKKYMELLNDDGDGNIANPGKKGLARELARMVLPTNYYTQWYWKIDLHNLLHFISLRADSHAQFEIREYANVLSDIVKLWVPYAWEAFEDYRMNGANISAQEVNLIRDLIQGRKIIKDECGLTAREWKEFAEKFNVKVDL